MSVRINLHPNLYQYTGDRQCLRDLVKQFPELKKGLFSKDGKLLNYVDIYVNQESSYPEELAKPVKDGDELYIAFMIARG